MTYVLIVIFALGYGGRTNIRMQEFSSLESCGAAADIVLSGWKNSGDRLYAARCTPK